MEQRNVFSSGQPLSERELTRRLRAAASPGRRASPGNEIAGRRGDDDLNPGLCATDSALVRAAVLVPIVTRPAGLTVLLTRRTDHLYAHAGQISFPGGQVEAGEDAVAAALRETEEEVGLSRDRVEIVGRLDTYVTRTGFEVMPLVGLVRPPFRVEPDSFEVAEVFEVPLDFILAPGSRRTESRVYEGRRRHFYVFPYGDYYIWGATAGMLVNLVEVLTGRGKAAAHGE